jgi:hypothetical protein
VILSSVRLVDGPPPACHDDRMVGELFGADGIILVVFVMLVAVALITVIASAFRSRS